MKRNKLTPRAIARRICRAHNDYRRKTRWLNKIFGDPKDNSLTMDKDETRDWWGAWSKHPLRHHWKERFPEFVIPVLPRPMTHAEARKLVAEQGVLPT